MQQLVALHECETWSLILSEEILLRQILGSKKGEVNGGEKTA
jgi:hypothetical protein